MLLVRTLLLCVVLANGLVSTSAYGQAESIDLREADWGEGTHFKLDGLWQAYWGELLTPDSIDSSIDAPTNYPVPGVWTSPSPGVEAFPPLGYVTYRQKVLVPEDLAKVYLYLPDMPSAYRLWVNGERLASNGQVGFSATSEVPGFIPKTVEIDQPNGQLDLILQVSNFHYREGGVWFSLKLTDESGVFSLRDRPIMFAIFAGAVLIALGIYNSLLFVYRSKEVAALNFGLLCCVVGVRRLLIDERIIYYFDWFSWSTLQRVEHICFYLTLPLFMGFFVALFPQQLKLSITRLSWFLITPFLFICLAFPARIYTELNLAFQILVLIAVSSIIMMYGRELKNKGKEVAGFGMSLLVLFIAVANDVLKANDLIETPNIAHFGVFAFILSQSIAFQRRYLNSLNLVEVMSHELKERNEELVKQDEFKDEFLANTSHELRTPLHGIAGLAKSLQDHDEGLSVDQKSKVDLIANTSKRLGLLVNDILDFSSIKHNKLKLHPADVDLSLIANVVIKTVKPLVGDKTIELTAVIDSEVRFLNADEYRLQQVLFNVMGNAVKFTERGFIRLTAHKANESIIIEVSDSGIGIPSEKLSTLFRPFEQAHVDGELSAGGTGLGLSISRQLVQLHGGSLDVQSEYGKGTSVFIRLPNSLLLNGHKSHEQLSYIDDEVAASPKADVLRESGQLNVEHVDYDSNGPLVFVVDDEIVNRELVLNQLHDHGYRVETFHDGLSFLARLNEQIPDLVLLDYMMPKMNGIEVCESIRRRFDSFEVPVMMLTARHQISDIVKALGAGANDYLVKPYHDKELIARVESQLNARKYWIANRENQKLKHEIERREALEEELSETNSRLLSTLDMSDEKVILINAHSRVVYSNSTANQYFDMPHKSSLLGLELASLINGDVAKACDELLAKGDYQPRVVELGERGQPVRETATLKCFKEKDALYIALLISPSAQEQSKETQSSEAITGLVQELAQSRTKIEQIESAIKQFYSSSSVSEEGAKEREPAADAPISTASNKESLVALHRMTLNLWERYTNKGKAELAEASRCWRVYIDGTTVKTRTFDKYLSAKTVPDKPRWRPVVRTANFVLSNCELDASERTELLSLVESIEEKYS